MSNGLHNNIYSAEDIQNYLSGKLTPLQMNAMEKAALDDPFLAEAMEGYDAAAGKEWKKELDLLKASFAQKQEAAPVVALHPKRNNWLKAAAAILVIGTMAGLSYFVFNKSGEQTIAKNDSPQTADPAAAIVAAPDSDSIQAANNTELTATTVPGKPARTIVKDVTRIPAELLADSEFVYTPAVADKKAGNADAAGSSAQEEIVSAKTAAPAPVTTNALPAEAANNAPAVNQKNYTAEADALKKESKADAGLMQRQEIPLNKTFFAQVLGADNTPLPFAKVNIKTENFGTYADVKGNFRLLSNDSILTVEVKAAGFKSQMVTLKSNVQQNRIILSEDNTAYKNKTVIGGNTIAKNKPNQKPLLIKDSVMNVEPADGWDNYNSYVDNNIDIPDDILKNNIHGEVELSFDVKASGAITNIKVDKSLCGNCDQMAIRMLQQGPQWKVKKGKKGRGKVTVHF